MDHTSSLAPVCSCLHPCHMVLQCSQHCNGMKIRVATSPTTSHNQLQPEPRGVFRHWLKNRLHYARAPSQNHVLEQMHHGPSGSPHVQEYFASSQRNRQCSRRPTVPLIWCGYAAVPYGTLPFAAPARSEQEAGQGCKQPTAMAASLPTLPMRPTLPGEAGVVRMWKGTPEPPRRPELLQLGSAADPVNAWEVVDERGGAN